MILYRTGLMKVPEPAPSPSAPDPPSTDPSATAGSSRAGTKGGVSPAMDDLRAQFIIAVADLCASAALAGLIVELTTAAHQSVRGVPGSIRAATDAEEEVDESGYARTFRVNGYVVRLDEVLSCTVRTPVQDAASSATA